MKKFPADAILNKLNSAGHEAFYVGGCVRDSLLGRTIHDWDITTSALPEETMNCFDRCIPTGIKHGTVTVLYEGISAEVTTFRCDGAYADGRHPDLVRFVKNIREDLARRDFTVNAMAMDVTGKLIDPFGGQEDLKRKIIRCVGDPVTRFCEDALRMLRAFRFSAQLGFNVEKQTLDAIRLCADRCASLSVERIRDEVEKTLLSRHPEYLQTMAEYGLLPCCRPDPEQDCRWLGTLPEERTVRWTGLKKLWPELDLGSMRLEKRLSQTAALAASFSLPENRLEWKRLIADHGIEPVEILASLYGEEDTVHALLNSGECMCIRDLAIKGSDLTDLTGKQRGEMLRDLLYRVLEKPELNEKEKLLRIYKNSIDYHY